ncbi:GP46-like surface antigen, putative [Bodo saltans]|uniref:GP46-like surface antigen, putative n=1 Tax=Bodo saltans TaxID=75058 RepID=A0A0S4IXG7_BODSA|nr:GP46-like surface antigen, putative [Bodo saltans]|eukprot:CUF55939.1 GP46-like surface antigen, putative [Bodo saltans]
MWMLLLSSGALCVVDASCACAYRLPVLLELYDATNGAEWVRPWNMTDVNALCSFRWCRMR